MTKTPLKIGLIGAGRIGRLHAENIAARVRGAKLTAVADIDHEAAKEVSDQHNVKTTASDYRDLLSEGDVDAVAICSATDTHAAIIQDAAKAGLHIFCEKPIDFDLDRIDETLRVVGASGVKFQVGFNRRFDANFSRVKRLLSGGEIGDPQILRITSRDPEPPPIEYVRVSGGIFLDMTIHDFDMARFLMGSEAREIYATGGVMVDPEIGEAGDIDTAVITLIFENGAIGTIDNSRKSAYGYDQRVEVFGSKGMVTVANNTPDSHVLSDAAGIHSAKPLHFFLERYTESYITEMQAFVDAVVEDKPAPVSGLDGRQPVVMGLAAQKSLAENRPIRLSEIA